MSNFRAKSHPPASSYRLLDFESVEVTGGVAGSYFLTVRGERPCLNMQVTLSPYIYIRCPEYWGIEVVGHLPGGICLDAIGRYEETIELTGITGSQGIEVIGATKTELREVPGGCDASAHLTADRATDDRGERFIVIALTGSTGRKHTGCRLVHDDDMYPAIYSQVFGPASRPECEEWMEVHCGYDEGDPA